MRELFIERMSWPEIQAALQEGMTTAVVCAASTEQHGPHLPEATDALLGAAYAEGLARRLGNALVAPVIRPACSEHHMGFAGSLTIPPELLMDLLDHHLTSLRRHGFVDFVVFSSHGGNYPVLKRWATERPHPDTTVIWDFGVFGDAFDALRAFGREDIAGPHAEVIETSMMLRLHPELVHMDRAEPGFEGEMDLPGLLQHGMRHFSANGIIGNPVGATQEIGQACLAAIVEALYARTVRP